MKMSKVAQVVGIPLPQTSPASVERFLIEKIRQDLGDFKDLAEITPVLRVDGADGDMSGNISNGYGNIMLSIGQVRVHVPFIIHNKELLPFDVIRLGDQEVSYDSSKLRRVINGIDRKLKESDTGEAVDGFSMGEVVDSKKVRGQNGFLGTIMQTRDNEISRHGNGMIPFTGPDFGSLDDIRIDKFANSSADVMEVFTEAVEKMANITFVPESALQDYFSHLEKQASCETPAEMRDQFINMKNVTLEQQKVKREMTILDKEKLADVRRAASGNDILIPVRFEGMFEHRGARAYHELVSLADGSLDKKHTLVVDHKGHYRLLTEREPFMMTVREPKAFELKTETVRGLTHDRQYVMEMGPQMVSRPFVVKKTYTHDKLHGKRRKFLYHGFDDAMNDPINSLFTEAIHCQETFGENGGKYFTIIVDRNESELDVHMVTHDEIVDYIAKHAMDTKDAQAARHMIDECYNQNYIICGPHVNCFKLHRLILGFFKSQDGYFSEGPFSKEAAYNYVNQVKLIVEKDSKPRMYAIEVSYADESEEQSGDADEASKMNMVQMKEHRFASLSEHQARVMLEKLGFDHRKIEMFFEVTKRNGRQAMFEMPSADKAKALLPSTQVESKKEQVIQNLAKSALNSNNFMPVFEDMATTGLSHMLAGAFGNKLEFAKGVADFMKQSKEVAVDMEKYAHQFKGASWHELSALMNLKYRLDKVAEQVISQHIALDAYPVFEKVAELLPKIASYEKQLINMNRRQMLEYDRPIVSSSFLKKAIAQLDGLTRYAYVAGERPGKFDAPHNEGHVEKQAMFFQGYRNLRSQNQDRLKALMPQISAIKKEMDKAREDLRRSYLKLRGEMNHGSTNVKIKTRLENEIKQRTMQVEGLEKQLRDLGLEEGDLQDFKLKENMAILGAGSVPVVGGLAYGYQMFKDQ